MRPIRQPIAPDVDPDRACVEAKQMIDLLTELREELEGMDNYASLLISLLERKFPQHRKLLKVLWGVKESQRHFLAKTFQVLLDYRSYAYDYEHTHGEIDTKPLPPLAPFAVSLEELMSVSSNEDMWRDFLDG